MRVLLWVLFFAPLLVLGLFFHGQPLARETAAQAAAQAVQARLNVLRCQRIPGPPQPVTTTIPVEGATLRLGRNQFIVPAGALEQPGEFTFQLSRSDSVLVQVTPPAGFTRFRVPASLVIDYRQWQCRRPQRELSIWRLGTPQYRLYSTHDRRNRLVRADSIWSLSRYVIASE